MKEFEPSKNVEIFPLLKYLPSKFRKPLVVATTMTAAAFVSAAPVCGENGGGGEADFNEHSTNELSLPFDENETWYFTGGPHQTGSRIQIRNALDFAPTEIPVRCPQGQPSGKFARAAADGEVIIKGDENDRSSQYHSVVVLEHAEGLITGYVHLDNILVEDGDQVQKGDPLGNPSCETPAGIPTTGVHLHFFTGMDESFVPVDGLNLSGWVVGEGPSNYDGTMVKQPRPIRTADESRCGPDESSIARCGGIRNDLGPVDVAGIRVTAEPAPTDLSSLEEPNAEGLKDLPTNRQELIIVQKHNAMRRTQQFIDLLRSGTASDIQAAVNLQIPENLQAINYLYNKATFDELRICSEQMKLGDFRDENFSVIGEPYPYISETDILNQQIGLDPRDRYSIGVTFRYRDYNSVVRQRIQYIDYDDPYSRATYVVFEDVEGELYITNPSLCTGGRTPLSTFVSQPPNE